MSELYRVLRAILRGVCFVALTLVGAIAGAGVVVLRAIQDLAERGAKVMR